MGAVIAAEFHKKHVPFVIIEMNETKINIIQESGYIHIHGDATLDDILIDAGIKECKGCLLYTSDAADE